VGDSVQRGDIIAQVETEKGNIDVEVFCNGTIEKLLIRPGEKVPVGTALAILREDGQVKSPLSPADEPATPPPASRIAPQRPRIVRGQRLERQAAERLAISPSARRLARELGVAPESVKGTGHGGAITRQDIERAAISAGKTSVPEVTPPPASSSASRIRQTIAAAMSRSKREIPHYYLATTIDMHCALEWLSEHNSKLPVADRVLHGALILKAVALALHEVPELNATWQNGQSVPNNEVHVGVAVSLRHGGLVAPAVHNTDQLTLDVLMRRLGDLVNRARAGSLRSSEMSDPTITVTSLGDQGVESVYAVIYPPQVAMVGVGKIVERPWCVNGQVVPRRLVTITLAADHRVSDGHRGGIFLAAIDRLLQEPEKL
jgi:pyruvate dehydrogenase E2 component (dihydrolipoamide acetyltransferase)